MHTFRNIVVSATIAVLLCVSGYFSNNWSLFSSENLNFYLGFESVKRLFSSEEIDYPGAFFVNTSFDKKLVNVYEDDVTFEGHIDNVIGKTEITDRQKLLQFLRLLSKTDYGYIVIDIRFAKELAEKDSVNRQIDHELFEFIKAMPRCVVATHKEMELLDGLESKAALADYKSTVTATNFVRYQYFDSIQSIPLLVYNEFQKVKGRDTIGCIDRGPLNVYYEGDKLCTNSLFLEFSSQGFPSLKKICTEKGDSVFIQAYNYKNMGSDYVDILESFPEETVLDFLIADMKKGGEKPIVFVGNITEDLHDTYAGLQPGVIILYKAFDAISKGRHLISWWHEFALLLLYFIISLFILSNKNIWNFIPRKWQQEHVFFCFILELASLTTVLMVVDFIDVLYFHTTTNFFFTIILLSLLKLYIQFKRFETHETVD